MGGVKFEYLVPPTGKKPVTVFTDSLIAPDQPFGIGDDWFPILNLVNPPFPTATGYDGADFAANINRGALGLTYTNTGAGIGPPGGAVPMPLDYTKILFVSQFSQMQITAFTAGFAALSIACFYRPNFNQLYNLEFISSTSDITLTRLASTTNTILSAAIPVVLNDIVRLEADIKTTPGTTTLRVFVNGVLKSTVLDASGSRLTSGVPALYFVGCSGGESITVANYQGGAL